MKIGIIGTGYVGLVSTVCFASVGHTLVSIDRRDIIVDSLTRGIPTIYEENMESMLQNTIASKSITFSSDFNALKDCEVVFLAVGTPSLPNGHADLSQVFSAIDSLLPIVSLQTMIAVRSTVPVGTISRIRNYLASQGKQAQMLGFCPEFLREGVAISDFLNPSYLVFASEQKEGCLLLQKVYQPIIDKNPEVKIVCCTTYETAELTKYTINSFLATKITFMNQIAQLAQSSGADMSQLISAIGADRRIGDMFLTPGPGFGGSCFPKDTLSLVKCGISYGVDMSVVEAVNHANERHKEYVASWILEELEKHVYVEGKTIAVWGLTFKAGTDDVRDSAAIKIIRSLLIRNIKVRAYDPKGNQNFQQQVGTPNLVLCSTPIEAIINADALVVLTEWPEFSKVDVSLVKSSMNGTQPFVFDTRGILPLQDFKQQGFITYKFGI